MFLVLSFRGINVLEKPELEKALQNRRETQRRKEWDNAKNSSNKRTSFELKLEERASRMKVLLLLYCPEVYNLILNNT